MSPIFKKLNLKDQEEIVVINAPESFKSEIASLVGVVILPNLDDPKEITFALSFVTRQEEITEIINRMAHKIKGDAIIWFAYPKGTSKKYKSEINRDRGWDALGKEGFEPVRQVAIDEDWSALRFRRVKYIKTMKRRESFALSKQGKAKTQKVAGNPGGAAC